MILAGPFVSLRAAGLTALVLGGLTLTLSMVSRSHCRAAAHLKNLLGLEVFWTCGKNLGTTRRECWKLAEARGHVNRWHGRISRWRRRPDLNRHGGFADLT